MRSRRCIVLALLAVEAASAAKKPKKEKEPTLTPLDVYVQQAHASARQAELENPGSLFTGPTSSPTSHPMSKPAM